MELKALADALRQGDKWQYANGQVLVAVGRHLVGEKAKAEVNDVKLVRVASTCADCEMSVPDDEITKVVANARNLQSFLNLICRKIEHTGGCAYLVTERTFDMQQSRTTKKQSPKGTKKKPRRKGTK